MIQLTDVEKKEQISSEVKSLVEKLNIQIHLANEMFLKVSVRQNDLFAPKSSDVTASIYEMVSY